MRKSRFAILVFGILLIATWNQQIPAKVQDAITIGPARRTNLLAGPVVGKSKWDSHGYFIHFQQDNNEHPLMWVYDRHGQLISRISPIETLQDARLISLKDVVVTKDKTLLVTISVVNQANTLITSGLLEYDMEGSLTRVIKTDPFVPHKVAVDDDNNIWLLGYDWQQLHKNLDWSMIQKVSADGVPIASALPRSLFSKELNPLNVSGPGITSSDVYFEVVGDEVYAWLPGVNQLAALTLDGQVLQLVSEPFRDLFKQDKKFVAVRSVVFLPEEHLIVQGLEYSLIRKNSVSHGLFFSPDFGHTWSPVAHNLKNPLATTLIGLTGSRQAVTIRMVEEGTGVLEFPEVFLNFVPRRESSLSASAEFPQEHLTGHVLIAPFAQTVPRNLFDEPVYHIAPLPTAIGSP